MSREAYTRERVWRVGFALRYPYSGRADGVLRLRRGCRARGTLARKRATKCCRWWRACCIRDTGVSVENHGSQLSRLLQCRGCPRVKMYRLLRTWHTLWKLLAHRGAVADTRSSSAHLYPTKNFRTYHGKKSAKTQKEGLQTMGLQALATVCNFVAGSAARERARRSFRER